MVKLCDRLVEQKRTKWIGPIRDLLNDLKLIAETINIDTNSKDWPKLSNGLSRRLNEIRTSLLDGFKIKVTIEKLTSPKIVVDEIDKTNIKTFPRNTTLVTIERLSEQTENETRKEGQTCSDGSDLLRYSSDPPEQSTHENQTQNDTLLSCSHGSDVLGDLSECPDCGVIGASTENTSVILIELDGDHPQRSQNHEINEIMRA